MGNGKKIRSDLKMKLKGTAAQRLTDRLINIQDTLSGRFNAYLCDTCGKGYLTLDVDRGTTPMFTPCFATQDCKGPAMSAGYPDGRPPLELGDPIIYWYKPNKAEFSQLSFEMQEHVRNGGLVRKATEAAPEWVKRAA